MRRTAAHGGYTIIEVMLFLAISAVIFVFAIVAVGGQQAHTEFSTAVNDVNTKFQQWIDQVNNGFSNSTAGATLSNFQCSIGPNNRPVLSPGLNARGANPECIFLGKAIQVNDASGRQDPRQIFAYTVLGRRVDPATGQDVSSLAGANPIPAIFKGISGGDLTETYTIPNGARVLWAKGGTSLTNLTYTAHLAGFYTSFDSGVSNGAQSLATYMYNFSADYNGDVQDGSVATCLEMTGACANPPPLNQWTICLESTRNGDTAAISIVSTNGQGASTRITTPCP